MMPTFSPCCSRKAWIVVCVSSRPVKTTSRQRSGFSRFSLIDEPAEPLKLGARGHSGDDGANCGGKLLRNGAVPCHVVQLRHQRIWATGQSLQDRNLRESIQLLDRLGNSADQLKLRRRRVNLVHLHDPVREIEFGIAAPDP